MSYYGQSFQTNVAVTPGGFRGDPGFLSVLGKIGKGILGIGSAVGVPGTGALSKVVSVGTKIASSKAGKIVGAGINVAKAHPVLTAAGGAAAIGAAGAGLGHMGAPGPAGRMLGPGTGMLHVRGTHISRRTGLPVRNRRMNVCNTRALNRAIRRCHGFARVAKKVLHFTSPHKSHRGTPTFKRRRKAK